MADDPREIVFDVRVHRAARHAGWFKTVIAADGEVVALGEGVRATFDLSHSPPEYVGRIAVLFVAGYDAALAADALRHVEVKAILLARAGHRQFVMG